MNIGTQPKYNKLSYIYRHVFRTCL